MIKLEYGDLSGMKSELQGFRDLSAFRHFEIGVLVCNPKLYFTFKKVYQKVNPSR